MATDDPDGFDQARRDDVKRRMVAMQGKHERDRRLATMTPVEIAEHDLAAMIELQGQYEAADTPFPVTDANTAAMAELIAERRAEVDRLGGSIK
jgi:hypothetical protein